MTKREQIKNLIIAMINDEQVRESLWNDLVHTDEMGDITISIFVAEYKAQLTEFEKSLWDLIEDSLNQLDQIAKELKNVEKFSQKLLTSE